MLNKATKFEFLCLTWPSASFALQFGDFVSRDRSAERAHFVTADQSESKLPLGPIWLAIFCQRPFYYKFRQYWCDKAKLERSDESFCSSLRHKSYWLSSSCCRLQAWFSCFWFFFKLTFIVTAFEYQLYFCIPEFFLLSFFLLVDMKTLQRKTIDYRRVRKIRNRWHLFCYTSQQPFAKRAPTLGTIRRAIGFCGLRYHGTKRSSPIQWHHNRQSRRWKVRYKPLTGGLKRRICNKRLGYWCLGSLVEKRRIKRQRDGKRFELMGVQDLHS